MTTAKTAEPGLNIRKVAHGHITWLDVVEPGLAELEYLRQTYNFHQLALEDCLSQVELPKLDNYDDYLFLVLQFPQFRQETRLTKPVQVNFFVSGDYLVTVHSGELQPLFKLFSDCEVDDRVCGTIFGHDSGHLLYRVLSDLVGYMFPALTRLIQSVDKLEAGIFEGGNAGTLSKELALARRDILSYRRIVRPQIGVMELLESAAYPFLRIEPDVYFGNLADSMRRIRVELDDLLDMIVGLNDTHLSLTSQHTTEVIRILTVVFTVTLPLSLIASLYGMNVRLPLASSQEASSPETFWIVMGIIGLTTGAMLAYLRLRRWF